ncbi:MAG: hypothetical protein F6K58_00585 [Symploca sp. SIO2E9]|nr:hypothetical protein [Symploca sp. SIO2E9]
MTTPHTDPPRTEVELLTGQAKWGIWGAVRGSSTTPAADVLNLYPDL